MRYIENDLSLQIYLNKHAHMNPLYIILGNWPFCITVLQLSYWFPNTLNLKKYTFKGRQQYYIHYFICRSLESCVFLTVNIVHIRISSANRLCSTRPSMGDALHYLCYSKIYYYTPETTIDALRFAAFLLHVTHATVAVSGTDPLFADILWCLWCT